MLSHANRHKHMHSTLSHLLNTHTHAYTHTHTHIHNDIVAHFVTIPKNTCTKISLIIKDRPN